MKTKISHLPTFRFGIMCSGTIFSAWEAACIRSLIESKTATPELLIVEDPDLEFFAAQRKRKLWEFKRLLFRVFNQLVVPRVSKSLHPVDLADELENVPEVHCRVKTKGKFSQYFSGSDVENIKSCQLDFILRFGFNIIRGDILEAAKYGVWSYHHDDEQKYRGGPPCFWEIYHRDHINGAILQRLTNRLDGGIILYKGFFPTFDRYSKNLDRIYFGTADWCTRVCRKIQLGQTKEIESEPVSTSAPIYLQPTNGKFINYVFRQGLRHLKRLFVKLFGIELWSVGLIEASAMDVFNSNQQSNIRWFKDLGNNRFIADPFLVENGNVKRILVEDYDYMSGKGHISEFDFPDGFENGELRTAIDLPEHLSYPSIVRSDDKVFCLPENLEKSELQLFEWVHDGQESKWRLKGCILDDRQIVDPTFFEFDGRWWMFCLDGETNSTETDLHIFHSECISGPWVPHALNPVKSDVRNARPAGAMFMHDNKVYRPAQDSSKCYGYALALNEVKKLTPTEFEEDQIGLLEPNRKSDYPVGLHTLVQVDDKTIIDGKRIKFSFKNLFVKTRLAIRRFFGK